jgi:hypothetical protein
MKESATDCFKQTLITLEFALLVSEQVLPSATAVHQFIVRPTVIDEDWV